MSTSLDLVVSSQVETITTSIDISSILDFTTDVPNCKAELFSLYTTSSRSILRTATSDPSAKVNFDTNPVERAADGSFLPILKIQHNTSTTSNTYATFSIRAKPTDTLTTKLNYIINTSVCNMFALSS